MRIERLTEPEEREWRERFTDVNWLLGGLALSVTLPEFAEGEVREQKMHFGYYLQSLHLAVMDREDLPRKLVWVLVIISPQTYRPLMLLVGAWAILR